ncbi:hypothetical protein HDE_09614 [Halotydeus destructor]|nr:hypothetical protein HDE_09614 [Halotydeus destructor]
MKFNLVAGLLDGWTSWFVRHRWHWLPRFSGGGGLCDWQAGGLSVAPSAAHWTSGGGGRGCGLQRVLCRGGAAVSRGTPVYVDPYHWGSCRSQSGVDID